MKNLTSDLSAHLARDVTTLATCWKVSRRDGRVQGFTDHDKDVRVGETHFIAASGFTPSAVASSAALNVDDLDIEGVLSDDAIAERDLQAGLYDYAEITVFQVDYTAPDNGTLNLRTGWLGEVQTKGERFIAEVRGLTQQLSQTLGERYSPACRADLGDARCRVDLSGFTRSGTITSITNARSIFTDITRNEVDGYFTAGTITFTSGVNNGLTLEVKQYSNGEFVCVLPFPGEVVIGDSYTAIAGCDKRIETCINVFNNTANFRGEPHVPGIDRVLETAGTRSSSG